MVLILSDLFGTDASNVPFGIGWLTRKIIRRRPPNSDRGEAGCALCGVLFHAFHYAPPKEITLAFGNQYSTLLNNFLSLNR
jgi:hypothetical protein